jgi:hypothetical protein
MRSGIVAYATHNLRIQVIYFVRRNEQMRFNKWMRSECGARHLLNERVLTRPIIKRSR